MKGIARLWNHQSSDDDPMRLPVGSPIEQRMLDALVAVSVLEFRNPLRVFGGRWDDGRKIGHASNAWQNQIFPDGSLVIESQAVIGRYRADFLLTYYKLDEEAAFKDHNDPDHVYVWPFTTKQVVVECDGHDYHDRTKKQATSDKKRDRHIKLMGYETLRFTGSEIHRDSRECAIEVLHFLGIGD